MNIFELSAKITADTTDFDTKVGNMVSSGVKKFAALTTAAGAAITAFAGKKAIETGMEFDKAMSQVQATMLKTNEEMEASVGRSNSAYGEFTGNLREFAQFLGENTVFSATQAAEALNYMALAGYDTQESMDMLPNVLSLAAAGNFDLARASDMVTDAQTAFGISAKRTTQMVDEMAKTASISNTSVEQMGDAFLVVGGLAKELNGGMVELADGMQAPVDGLQELEIALGAMANAGIKGSEAGTHMRNMLLKLSSPTAEGTKQLEALGVQVFDSEGKMRSLNDVFGDLSVSMSGLTQEEKLQAISDLFNTRDTASAEALLAAVSQDWDEIGEGILNASGAAGDMSKIQLDNLSGDITLMKSAMEGLQIAISDGVSPALRTFVQKATGWIQKLTTWIKDGGLKNGIEAIKNGFDKISEAISPLTNKLVELFSSEEAGATATSFLSTAFDVIAKVLGVISNILAFVIDKLAIFFEWITSGSTSADIFIAVITGIVTALSVLLGIIKGFTIIQTIIQSFQMLSGVFMFLAANPIVLIIAAIAGLVIALITLYNNNEEFRTKVQAIWEAITGFFETAAEVIQAVWEKVVEFFTNAWESIKKVWDVVVEYFTLIWESIKTVFSVVKKIFQGDFQGAWDAIRNIVGQWVGFFSGIWNSIANIFSVVGSWFSNIFSSAAQGVMNAFSGIGNFFVGIWNNLTGIVSGIANSIYEWFSMAWDWISNIDWLGVGTGIINGIINGIGSAGSALVDYLVGWARAAWQSAKNFLGIRSPSKLFSDTIGKMIPLGIAEGIEDEGDSVNEALENIMNPSDMDIADSYYSVEDSIGGYSGYGSLSRSNVNSSSGVVINVYATERQDEEEIAREVQRVFIQWENQRKAAYA